MGEGKSRVGRVGSILQRKRLKAHEATWNVRTIRTRVVRNDLLVLATLTNAGVRSESDGTGRGDIDRVNDLLGESLQRDIRDCIDALRRRKGRVNDDKLTGRVIYHLLRDCTAHKCPVPSGHCPDMSS